MEKFNFVRDGGNKLPPGFRFQPTDEEIVFQYLAPKIFSCPLPATVIPEIHNIFSFDPWDLPGGGEWEQDKYFFSNDKESNYRNVKSGMRATRGGYWRVIGSERQTRPRCSKKIPMIVGMKKTLAFWKGKSFCAAARTNWFMHLYYISVPTTTSSNVQHQGGCSVQIGKWDVCHIFLKKMCTKAGVYVNDDRLIRNYDMTTEESDDAEDNSSCASSSNSGFNSDASDVSSSNSGGQ